MMIYQGYIDELSERIPDKDSLKLVKEEAKRFEKRIHWRNAFRRRESCTVRRTFRFRKLECSCMEPPPGSFRKRWRF